MVQLATSKTTPQKACFAIAGSAVNNTAKLSNLTWFSNAQRLEQELEIASISLINDFTAVSYGVLVQPINLYTLQLEKHRAKNLPLFQVVSFFRAFTDRCRLD